MSVKLLTEHHLEFLSLKGGIQARLSLHLSKCHIVGNHMPWLVFYLLQYVFQSVPTVPLLKYVLSTEAPLHADVQKDMLTMALADVTLP